MAEVLEETAEGSYWANKKQAHTKNMLPLEKALKVKKPVQTPRGDGGQAFEAAEIIFKLARWLRLVSRRVQRAAQTTLCGCSTSTGIPSPAALVCH